MAPRDRSDTRGRSLTRTMVDANVLVAGNVFPRWPYEVLRHALLGDYQLLICPYIIKEAQRTVARAFPEHTHRLERFLKTCPYQEVKDPSEQAVKRNLRLVRSAKDVPIVLAAKRARISHLVTNDKDLTVEDKTTETIRQWFKPILPAVFLKEVMGWTSEALETIRHRTWEDLES